MPEEVRKIDKDTLGITPEERIVTREKLNKDLFRHQNNKQENEEKYLKKDEKSNKCIVEIQSYLDLLNGGQ